MHPRVEKLIKLLQLQAHPEGGYFCETYRSELQVHSTLVTGLRSSLTDIYFLLPAGQVSLWHRVAHDELWNFFEGAPLRLLQLSPDLGALKESFLDATFCHYKELVPAGSWQAAETQGEYSLVGCSVAPGFEFADFRLLKNLPEAAARVYSEYPDLGRFVC